MKLKILFLVLITISLNLISNAYSQAEKRKTPFFGIEENFLKEDEIASLSNEDIKNLGVKICRTIGKPFYWGDIEPKKGKFDFSVTDKVVEQASDAKVYLLATIFASANWDNRIFREPQIREAHRIPGDWQAYESFLKELAERYDGDDNFGAYPVSDELKIKIKKRPIIYWEIENEVDDPRACGFFGSLEDYVELLKHSYRALKEVSPNSCVLVSAPKEKIKKFYRELFLLGADKYFDVYNIHGSIEEMKEVMGDKIKPIWVTESGPSNPFFSAGYNEEYKEILRKKYGFVLNPENNYKRDSPAVNMAKNAIQSAMLGASAVFICSVPEWEKYSFKKSQLGSEKDFFEGHLLYKDGRKTPCYYALKTLVEELEYFDKVQALEAPKGIYAYKFIFGDKEPVSVYFLSPSEAESSEVSIEAKEYSVKDLFGNISLKKSESLKLKRDNVYFVKTKN